MNKKQLNISQTIDWGWCAWLTWFDRKASVKLSTSEQFILWRKYADVAVIQMPPSFSSSRDHFNQNEMPTCPSLVATLISVSLSVSSERQRLLENSVHPSLAEHQRVKTTKVLFRWIHLYLFSFRKVELNIHDDADRRLERKRERELDGRYCFSFEIIFLLNIWSRQRLASSFEKNAHNHTRSGRRRKYPEEREKKRRWQYERNIETNNNDDENNNNRREFQSEIDETSLAEIKRK